MEAHLRDLLETIRSSSRLRVGAARESHALFFALYLSKYAEAYPMAPFQHEILRLTEDSNAKLCVIVAFRDSAKSTLCTTSFPLWSILTNRAKFVVIASHTRVQARQHLANIREEVEHNALLKNDLGPFRSQRDEWGAYAMVFPKYGAKIIAVSSEQSVRGLRFKSHRPDLIIADDLEDITSTQTQEGRDKTYRWYKGELLSAGTRATRTFVVGNLLHQDSLIMRLRHDIEEEQTPGEFRAYAILGPDEQPTWRGKFVTTEAVDVERRKINDPIIWEREFMLRIVAPEDQVIRREWIQFYDRLPKGEQVGVYVGVDLAIKMAESNDFTALVTGRLYHIHDRPTLYITSILNKRMSFPATIQEIIRIDREYESLGIQPEVLIEDVGLQEAWAQQLREHGVSAKGIKVGKVDKRSRLATTAHWIESGGILFPKFGVGPLIEQLVGFGNEAHDDLADAFSLLAIQVMSVPPPTLPEIFFLDR